MELSFWIPLFLLFASALVAGIVKRYSKDPCLKVFHTSFVFLKLKDGRWISGDLLVYANCLELEYREPQPLGQKYQKLSYVVYEHNLESIERILRPSPKAETPARQRWEREIYQLQNPSFSRRLARRTRNFFNILRDAFAQSVTLIFGTVKRRTRFAAVPVDEGKVGEMGRTLISVVPNAYEPILEKYLGHQVIVETLVGDKVSEQSGVLQEYSAKYILVRDVDLLQELPTQDPNHLFEKKFDVAFPRPASLVRHLARTTNQGA